MVRAGPDILELVGQLHEGLADEELWIRAVDSICGLLGVPGLLLGAVDRDGRAVHFEFARNAGQKSISLLEGPLNDPRYNPWIALARSHPLRRVATVEDVGGQQAFERSRMWSEFYLPLGLQDTLGGVLERQPEYSQVVIMTRARGKPDFGSADHRLLAAMLPHIARAWRVKRQLADWKARAGTLKLVLDRLDRAIVVTGPQGEIRFANRAADRLLSRGNGVDATGGRIRAARSRDTDALRLLIDGASRTGAGTGQIAVDAVAIRCRDDGPPLAVVAEPLAAAHGDRLGHEPSPGAVLFIGESEASSRPSVDRLRIVYGLTPAEARLTSLVVEGHDIASAARTAHVSENTVKYHLKTIFGKVGVARQAQLIRRVLADVGGLAEPEKMIPAASA
ncbi:MAG TPA: helix-turn-helix transcriptional regulator [Allosphingosinicella sp.]|nr:helix-turn-helix transcriptional regulator [Allosphingosinicella sp.]